MRFNTKMDSFVHNEICPDVSKLNEYTEYFYWYEIQSIFSSNFSFKKKKKKRKLYFNVLIVLRPFCTEFDAECVYRDVEAKGVALLVV